MYTIMTLPWLKLIVKRASLVITLREISINLDLPLSGSLLFQLHYRLSISMIIAAGRTPALIPENREKLGT